MSELKPLYSVEETLRIQTTKLNQQLNKLLEQNTQIIELTAERDSALAQNAELMAKIDRMQTFIKLSARKWEGIAEVEPTFWNLLRVANETPQQCLRDREAEVGRAGYQACLQNIGYHEPEWQDDANAYAEKVRRCEV